MDRRSLLLGIITGYGGLLFRPVFVLADSLSSDRNWSLLSKADWKKRLSPEAFAVLREESTERAFSSSLNNPGNVVAKLNAVA